MAAHLKHPNDLFIGNKTGTNNYIFTRSDKIFLFYAKKAKILQGKLEGKKYQSTKSP